ncbi:MAG: quinolinate synthase NadA [Anaerovoracaceae bacterium]
MNEKINKIEALKKEKNAVIMAHYYVADEIQQLADYVGDSYYLSETATKVTADTIVLCGVSFMGESAKILNPEKRVLLPDMTADCPMAHMADADKIQAIRQKYDDVAVVCYVNSTAELKACSDVCVTSSNALKIVSSLPNRNIYFIPDTNLAHFIAEQLPEKDFIFNDGFCHVHHNVTKEEVSVLKKRYPAAIVMAHPESRPEVLALADYVGSTSGIINHAAKSGSSQFIVLTEAGVLYELRKNNPDKEFFTTEPPQICSGMKKITLDNIISVLENDNEGISMDKALAEAARKPMERMLELSI